mgnify:CR=1 FL=1
MDIFLLEDDDAIALGLCYSLQNEGYNVTLAKSVSEATDIVEKNDFALYILDLTLPDGSGYDVCKKIKSIGDRPVIFLTAYDDEVNVVMGFDLGADDYITKPFRLKELLVRIKSVLRRYNRTGGDATVKIKNITINTNEAKVYKNGEEIEINIKGRHDPIIVPRAVVVVESMAAITIFDAMLSNMSARMDGIKDFYKK